jgi:hypothetical protein
MMTPHLARRFPLVARPRPACTVLEERVSELVRLADTAHQDPVRASAMLNQAALLASDVGAPDLARTWCHAHASARFTHLPGTGKDAIHALEPVVNLARLRIRNGDGDSALTLLENLFDAVSTRTNTEVDRGLLVPCSQLTASQEDHREVVRWVWMVLLADGTRAMTTSGRWVDALKYVRARNGVGQRMSDGRQVAVLAHATTGDVEQALDLIDRTVPGDLWENAVTSLLGVMCQASPIPDAIDQMIDRYQAVAWDDATAVFHTRLALSVIDVLNLTHPRSTNVLTDAVEHVLAAGNGYCARELLSGLPNAVLGAEGEPLAALVRECGLGQGGLPPSLRDRLERAVRTCLRTDSQS